MGIMIQFHCVITIFLISTDMYLRTNVPFQYTISGDREQVFLLYYKDFFEQICSDVQFISPPEEVGEFLLHLLNFSLILNTFGFPVNIKQGAASPAAPHKSLNLAHAHSHILSSRQVDPELAFKDSFLLDGHVPGIDYFYLKLCLIIDMILTK